ncbi:MAG: NAD(P)-dependent glycerol-3-phosphate dehydrogenase [Micavibrio sp.]|nr:NAD(P)-dependent glycerol-3-phosphate dehydrogenase [Micavibrio sp.]
MADLQNIAVIGAGAWGTALAEIFSRAGRDVTLYARDANLAADINASHENKAYLAGAALHAKLDVTADMLTAVGDADLVVLATPAQHLRATLLQFKPYLPKAIPLINSAKGIEVATGYLLSEVVAEVAAGHPYAALSGPTFANEAVKGLPTAITLAANDAALAERWAHVLRGKAFRPYYSGDVVGVEIAGALKNVIAIACGIVEGKKLGQNAKAAVMTRGIAEIKRFGLKRGAKAETFLGLSGIGDLTLTCSSMTSRNFSLGAELGQGKTLAEILAGRNTVAEGVSTAAAAAGYAEKHGVDMPIAQAVNAVLHKGASVDALVQDLLSRNLRSEQD